MSKEINGEIDGQRGRRIEWIEVECGPDGGPLDVQEDARANGITG